MAASYWGLHPEVAEAQPIGKGSDQWPTRRRPVVSYARISRGGREAALAARRQHANNEAAAVELGLDVVYRYTDIGITAADPNAERPAFQRLLQDVRVGRTAEGVRVRGIVAVEQERLVRLPADHLQICRALAAREDSCLYWVDSEQFVDVQAELARLEGEAGHLCGETETARISTRRRRSVRDRAREGRGTGGARRFGWLGPDARAQRPTNMLLDSREAPYLREAVDRALAGEAWTAIGDWLTAEAVPTVRGGPWTVPTVQAMVTNPAICGYRIVDGLLVRSRETGEPVIGHWEAIAAPEEWYALIQRCDRWYSLDAARPDYKTAYRSRSRGNGPGGERRARVARADQKRKYLLAGFLRCGHVGDRGEVCGFKMGGHPPHGTNRYASYRCSAAGCRKVGRRADLVDAHVESAVLDFLEARSANRLVDSSPCATQLSHERETPLPAGFTREQWAGFDVSQKRQAIAAVIEKVVVHPLPKSRPRNAPFDSSLVEVVPRRNG